MKNLISILLFTQSLSQHSNCKKSKIKMNNNLTQRSKGLFMACIFSILFTGSLLANPYEGPYGPIETNYELPQAKHIYYVAPDGASDASGTKLSQPTTIESALSRVVTGDAIILRGGVYRTGELKLNQGITMQAYADEKPVLKGTKLAKEGVALSGGDVWRIPWNTLFPAKPLSWWRRDREGLKTPLHRLNNDMVFVNGKALQSAGWEGEVNESNYYIDYEKKQVYVGVNPAKDVVEITAWNGGLTRVTTDVHGKASDKKGPVIRGITLTQYAWRAIEIEGKRSFGPAEEPTDEPYGQADPSSYGKEVIGTTLENVTISHCSRVAGYFRGDSLTIRQSLFSHTSTEGVYVIGSSDVLLERNIFRTNNVERLTGYYPSAVKIFNQSHRVVCRENLVMDNKHSNGIWYDVGNTNAVIVNNRFQDCGHGLFFEISKGALCFGNLFVNCDNGIHVRNAADFQAWNNIFVNSTAWFIRDNRGAGGDHFGWHIKTGPDIDKREGHVFVNNILVADQSFNRNLLKASQAKELCVKLKEPQFSKLDGNVYIRSSKDTEMPVIYWSPAEGENCTANFNTLSDFQTKYSKFEKNGCMLTRDIHSVFKSPELANYELLDPIKKMAFTVPVSKEIQNLLK